MRRSVVPVVIAAAMLSGCVASAPAETRAIPSYQLALASSSAAGAPDPGDCLLAGDGQPDWAAVGPCTQNHLFDVVSVEEWPGLQQAITEHGADDVFAGLTEGADYSAEYHEWAATACLASIRSAVGWTGDSADRFAEFAALPAAPLTAVSTIAERQTFVSGEHRTVCAVRWWESLRYPSEVALGDLFTEGFPKLTRTCWRESDDGSMYFVTCDGWHDAQSIVAIDLAAYGLDALAGERIQASLDTAAVDCEALVDTVLPTSLSDEYVIWSLAVADAAWDAWESGSAEPGVRYPVECLVGRADGVQLRGDLMLGNIEVAGL